MKPLPDYRPYTGIGSRQTPREVMASMNIIGAELERLGFTLRSGGAQGADSAFEYGVKDPANKEIYLPWEGFNGRRFNSAPTKFHFGAQKIAEQFHPVWDKLSPQVRLLHTRNVYQVLGPDLKQPSLFVICWTPGGKGEGGTGQAIRIAQGYKIPVFDLGGKSIQEVEDGLNEIFSMGEPK